MKLRQKDLLRAEQKFRLSRKSLLARHALTRDERMEMAAREVDRVLHSLPEPLRQKAAAVVLLLEDYPGHGILEDGFSRDLLGFFHGFAHADEAGHAAAPHPPQISLFLENIWSYAFYRPHLFRREVRITFLHELGHYLGFAEDDLELRGLG